MSESDRYQAKPCIMHMRLCCSLSVRRQSVPISWSGSWATDWEARITKHHVLEASSATSPRAAAESSRPARRA
jgi:hypothetical protein